MQSFYFGLLILLCIWPQESDEAEDYFPYRPDPWEIEEVWEPRFKLYDDENRNNATGSVRSVEYNKSCFGDGERDFRVVNYTDLVLLSFLDCMEYKFNELAHKYLSKYCKVQYRERDTLYYRGEIQCVVDYRQNKFVCGDGTENKGCPDGKSIAEVLRWISEYVEYRVEKFKLFGGKKKSIEDGKSCVDPPFKLPFHQKPTKKELEKLNAAARSIWALNEFCKSERCIYDYPSRTLDLNPSRSHVKFKSPGLSVLHVLTDVKIREPGIELVTFCQPT